jgi:hypothetical protein
MQRDDAHAWTVQFRAGADDLVASVVREEGAPRLSHLRREGGAQPGASSRRRSVSRRLEHGFAHQTPHQHEAAIAPSGPSSRLR